MSALKGESEEGWEGRGGGKGRGGMIQEAGGM